MAIEYLQRIFSEEDNCKLQMYKKRMQRRNKRNRSKIRFYKNEYRFKAPLRLLVDESFIRVVLSDQGLFRLGLAKKLISRFIGEKIQLFVTRCTIRRCYADMGDISQLFRVLRCGHCYSTSVHQCLQTILQTNNAGYNKKFILATASEPVFQICEGTPALPILLAGQECWSLMGASERDKRGENLRNGPAV